MRKHNIMKKGFLLCLAAAVLVSGLALSPASAVKAEAKAKAKTKVTATVKIGSKKVNKKTVTMKKGTGKTAKVTVKPKKKGLKVTYRSSKKSVVSVSKKGKLKAKKAGTAKITVTVSGKKIRTAKTWFKVKVPAKTAKKTDKKDDAEEPAATHTCTVSIDCITLAQNMGSLRDPSIASKVPADGWMLKDAPVAFTPGDTAYDVLAAACKKAGYEVEASYTPMYASYYVEGINGLYEFDGGPTSGWMYSVNGIYPSHASSAHTVSDGDVIRWRYTLDLGKDIGGSNTVGQ